MFKYTYKMSEIYEIGCKFLDEKQYVKALEYFQLAADQGLADAQNYLGNMYFNGYGVEKSYQKAAEYYQLAANQGSAKAQYILGLMYEIGYDGKQSYQKALEYFQLAADQGSAIAQCNLGYMYKNGYGVEKSFQKALEYVQLAADQGLAEAQYNLCLLKSSIKYIQYELSEQLKMNDLLRQQIEFLEIQLKYEPDDNGYQETKEHFESLTIDD